MTDLTLSFVVEVLREYEEKSGLSCFVIANKMEIESSNYYEYREGDGDPTCKTIDKILKVVLAEYPEIVERILERELKAVQKAMGPAKTPQTKEHGEDLCNA